MKFKQISAINGADSVFFQGQKLMNRGKFNERTAKPKYMYKRNPLVPHAFQIFECGEDIPEYRPVGEYTLLDTTEHTDLTEKKVINLITILNGRDDLIQLGNLTGTRLLYNIVPETPHAETIKIIFRAYDGEGVSKENAVLTLEKGVLHDDFETDSKDTL